MSSMNISKLLLRTTFQLMTNGAVWIIASYVFQASASAWSCLAHLSGYTTTWSLPTPCFTSFHLWLQTYLGKPAATGGTMFQPAALPSVSTFISKEIQKFAYTTSFIILMWLLQSRNFYENERFLQCVGCSS